MIPRIFYSIWSWIHGKNALLFDVIYVMWYCQALKQMSYWIDNAWPIIKCHRKHSELCMNKSTIWLEWFYQYDIALKFWIIIHQPPPTPPPLGLDSHLVCHLSSRLWSTLECTTVFWTQGSGVNAISTPGYLRLHGTTVRSSSIYHLTGFQRPLFLLQTAVRLNIYPSRGDDYCLLSGFQGKGYDTCLSE